MKQLAALGALVAACTAAAPAAGPDARAAYAGTWHGTGTFYTTAYSKAGASSDTTTCTWQGDKTYLVCIQNAQTPYGSAKQLTIYARNGDAYAFRRIEPDGTVHSTDVAVAGNTWTYTTPVDQNDKHVLFRTQNVFSGSVQRWRAEFSEDEGNHWTLMAQGVETRTASP